jgi:anion-transporting  ArsA/GET3 family ATPase
LRISTRSIALAGIKSILTESPPAGLGKTFLSGPVFDQAAHIDRILKNPENVHYVLVTLPEEMPVVETLELGETLKKEFNGQISLVVNKLLVPPLSQSERSQIAQDTGDQGLQTFVKYLHDKEAKQNEHLQTLSKFPFSSISQVPLILNATNNQNSIEIFAEHLKRGDS